MNYHPIVKQIADLLDKNHFWYETFEHEPVLTSEEASKTRPGYTLHQGAKAILAKIDKKDKTTEFVVFVIPADLRLDTKKIKLILSLEGMRFATEEELIQATNGVQRGALPPFGNLFGFKVYVDKSLLEIEKIVFNAGDRRFSVAMKSQDFITLVNPQTFDITEHL